mmetsp:Transcript_16326/g.36735  ORF Transcript_16326/g.36735 Transcript_16326/m.36735 type:complete len:236 (-) Transcript_16326:771-1478(-)
MLEGVAQEIIAGEEAKNDEMAESSTAPLPSDIGETSVSPLALNKKSASLLSVADVSSLVGGRSRSHAIVPAEFSTDENLIPVQKERERMDISCWKEYMPPQLEKKLEHMFRSDDEAREQEAIFVSLNADFIEAMEKKRADAAAAERAEAADEADEKNQSERQAKMLDGIRKKRKYSKKTDGNGASTAEEALLAAVSQRKVSRKINYDAMTSIFGDDGGFSADVGEGQDTAEDYFI